MSDVLCVSVEVRYSDPVLIRNQSEFRVERLPGVVLSDGQQVATHWESLCCCELLLVLLGSLDSLQQNHSPTAPRFYTRTRISVTPAVIHHRSDQGLRTRTRTGFIQQVSHKQGI